MAVFCATTAHGGLVSHYRFDETTGAVVDSFGPNNGTNILMNRGGSGKVAFAFSTPSYDSGAVALGTNLVPSSSDFSFSIWFKVNAQQNPNVLYAQHNGVPDTDRISFVVNSAGKAEVQFGGVPLLTGTTPVETDIFYFYSVTRSGDDWRLYLNEQLEATATSSSTLSTESGYFGAFENGAGPQYDGFIDEANFWDRALTGIEVACRYWRPIACYGFDQTSGPVIDATGYFDGTNLGMNRGVAGKVGFGFSTPGYFTGAVGVGSNLIPSTSDFSFAAWFKINAHQNPNVIYAQHNGAGDADRISLVINSAGNAEVQIGGLPFLTGTTLVSTGVYHFYSVTRSGDDWSLFVDGVVEDSTTSSETLSTEDGYFGAFENGAGPQYDGAIDQAAFWDRALTDEEIAELFESAIAVPTLSPIALGSLAFAIVALAIVAGRRHWLVCSS